MAGKAVRVNAARAPAKHARYALHHCSGAPQGVQPAGSAVALLQHLPQAKTKPVSDPLLSVVVPVRNEADNILPLLAEIDAAITACAVAGEIIYVDDGSVDATPSKLAEAGKTYASLRVLRHDHASGQSQAIASGIARAKGSIIVTLDGDGQNDPADIPSMLKRFQEAPDPDRLLVIGHRQKRQDTRVRRLASRAANGVRAKLLGDQTPDTGCGLKVFSRSAFLDMPRFDHMHRFMPALMLRRGGDAVSVPVNHRPRERGISKYGVLDRLAVSVADILGVMWLMRRTSNPTVTEPPLSSPPVTASDPS